MADHDLLDEQSCDALTLVHVERLDISTQTLEKCR